MNHTFTCIKCPLSCQVEVVAEGNVIQEMKGHTCTQGETYVIDEFTHPVRTLTTTVRVRDGILPVLPVKSEKPLPKNLIRKCVEVLNTVTVKAPVKCGDIVCENVLDTGVNVVASRDLPRKTLH